MNTAIDNDLEALSKKLYLESPDLWIEFLDKVGEKTIDEMVLFFATKYNFSSIVKFSMDNDRLNLDTPSKNSSYASIRAHLIATAKQYNCTECLDLLSGTNKNKLHTATIKQEATKQEPSLPTFICTNCKSNIFECGYRIINNTVHKFSISDNKLIELDESEPNKILCNNCNKVVVDATLDKIENICKIQCCNFCGMDLTKVGILDTSKLEFNSKNNKFISKSTHHSCGNCNNDINENQKIHFNL